MLTNEGTIEMEASIMDGRIKECGSVSGITFSKIGYGEDSSYIAKHLMG